MTHKRYGACLFVCLFVGEMRDSGRCCPNSRCYFSIQFPSDEVVKIDTNDDDEDEEKDDNDEEKDDNVDIMIMMKQIHE